MARKGPENRRKLGFFGALALLLNIFFAFALIISYVSVHISPETIWIMPFFGLLYPYLVIINLAFVLYWILRMKWLAVISLITILAGWNHLERSVQLQGALESPENQPLFKLMSYNVQNLSNDNVNLVNPSVRENIMRFVIDVKPDILCLQEFVVIHPDPDGFIDSISIALGLPYHAYAAYSERSKRKIGAIFTFSRFPILRSEGLKKDDIHHLAIISDIKWGTDTFRLFNVHLESVRLKHEDYQFISELDLQFEQNENIREGSKRIFSKLRTAYSKRAVQADMLVSKIKETPHPVILCGDFNDTPNSYAYQKLTSHLKDAFVESGHGFGNTYIGKLPSFRIDYILYDKHFSSRGFSRERVRYSDHYPVLCYIGIRELQERIVSN